MLVDNSPFGQHKSVDICKVESASKDKGSEVSCWRVRKCPLPPAARKRPVPIEVVVVEVNQMVAYLKRAGFG